MNTYIFLNLSRKSPPRLEGTIRAESPEEAIRKNKYYPFDPMDFHETRAEQQLPELTEDEMAHQVFAYYGLIEGADSYDCGNGPDGYGTQLIEIKDDDGQNTTTYPPPYPTGEPT